MKGLRRRDHAALRLPDDLDLAGLEVIRSFLHRTVRVDGPRRSRPIRHNRERVSVTTDRTTIECGSLTKALAALEPDQVVTDVDLTISTGRDDHAIRLVWHASGGSRAIVTGRSTVWVVGVHGVLKRFVDKRQYEVPQPKPSSWRLRGWLGGLSIEVVGTVLGAGMIALAGAVFGLVPSCA